MIGVWRSWLARRVWDAEVEGSSPFTPTIYVSCINPPYIFTVDLLFDK